VQFASIEALKKIKDISSVDALLQVLSKASDLVSVVIIETLGEMAHIKAVPRLLQKLEASSRPLQNKIVQALVSILGNNAFSLLDAAERERLHPALLGALEDEDPDVQNAAVRGLSIFGRKEAWSPIFHLLLQVDEAREPERFETMIEILQDLGMVQELHEAAFSGVPAASSLAIRILTGIDSAESRDILRTVFWDRERDEQRAITQSLSHTPDASSSDFFLHVLNAHEDGTIIKNCLHFLGRTMGLTQASDAVLGFLNHPFDDVKEKALEACIALDTENVRQRFRTMLDSDDPVLRFMAVYGLGRLRDQGSMPGIRRALQDEEPDVRKIALEALCPLAGEQEDVLMDMLEALNDESPEVRKALVGILQQSTLPVAEEKLREAMTDRDEWVCIRALESLMQRSNLSDQDVGFLMELFAESETILKLKIIDILGQLGGEASFKALFAILENENWEVQEAADRALTQIKTA
jgi:HEAT repeat protein